MGKCTEALRDKWGHFFCFWWFFVESSVFLTRVTKWRKQSSAGWSVQAPSFDFFSCENVWKYSGKKIFQEIFFFVSCERLSTKKSLKREINLCLFLWYSLWPHEAAVQHFTMITHSEHNTHLLIYLCCFQMKTKCLWNISPRFHRWIKNLEELESQTQKLSPQDVCKCHILEMSQYLFIFDFLHNFLFLFFHSLLLIMLSEKCTKWHSNVFLKKTPKIFIFSSRFILRTQIFFIFKKQSFILTFMFASLYKNNIFHQLTVTLLKWEGPWTHHRGQVSLSGT